MYVCVCVCVWCSQHAGLCTPREESPPAGFPLWGSNFCISATDREVGGGLCKVGPMESRTGSLLGDLVFWVKHSEPGLAVVSSIAQKPNMNSVNT